MKNSLLSSFKNLDRLDDGLVSQLLFYIPLGLWCFSWVVVGGRTSFAAFFHDSIRVSDVWVLCAWVLLVREVLFGRWNRITFLGFALLGVMCYCAVLGNWLIIAESLVFAFCGRNIPLRRHVAFFACFFAALLAITITCSQIGIIPDHVMGTRHYLGFVHPNTCAAFAFFLVCSYVFLRKGRMKIVEYVGIALLLGFIYYFTQSRTGLIVSVFVVILASVASRMVSNSRSIGALKAIAVGIVPLIAICAVSLCVFYDPSIGWMAALNNALSGRLALGHGAFADYNVHLFGQQTEFTIGNHYDMVTGQLVEVSSSNPIDCVYVKMLLRCGFLFTLIGIALVCAVLYRCVVVDDLVLAAIVVAIAVYGISESACLYLFFDPFIMAIGWLFSATREPS